MKRERINPTADAWRTRAALARAVRPYSVGSAYGTERAEYDNGARTVVRNLSTRSKSHANGREVVDALNAAHLEALGLGMSGLTNAAALAVLLPRVLELNAAATETAAVLLCDLFEADAGELASEWDSVQPAVRRLAAWVSDASQWEDVVQTVRTAVLLNADGVNA